MDLICYLCVQRGFALLVLVLGFFSSFLNLSVESVSLDMAWLSGAIDNKRRV